MSTAQTIPDAAADREIVLTRVFNAPRERVFEAYSKAGHLDRWFGPRGFTTATHAIEFRPGGAWSFTMTAPDGTVYPNRVLYREIDRPNRLVWDHGTSAEDPKHFEVTITFTDEEGGTRVTQRSLFPTVEARAAVVSFGAIELGQQTLEKLAEHLAGME
ncbi:MAG TPA: SRPBCC family protein [Longimicrobium sp.]|nr:SRPBCC family protein [Longimicrobium sp.]